MAALKALWQRVQTKSKRHLWLADRTLDVGNFFFGKVAWRVPAWVWGLASRRVAGQNS